MIRSHKRRGVELSKPVTQPALCATCGRPCTRTYCSAACYRVKQRSGSDEDRFWPKVSKSEGCWLWTASRSGAAKYGQFTQTIGPGQQRHVGAHVFSYELSYGPVPEGMEVMHSCNQPLCVRPDHLAAGTHAKNNADAARDGLFHVPRPSRQKMSDDQVEQAVSMVRSGMPQVAVAKAFGVTKATICRIMHGTLRQYRKPSQQRRTA